MIDVEPYEPCRAAGIVRRLRIEPLEGYLEATVTDGTGSLLARWDLPTAPRPISLFGCALVLEGSASIAPDGGLMMVDPACEYVDSPFVS
jgi:hypothetical protein